MLDEELVWSAGYGHANPTDGTPADADTIYSICSISKLFTAIGVMQLSEQGKLRLSDAVADHLPWFEALQPHLPDAAPITIEMLLTHSAGLPREAADFAYWSPPDFLFPTTAEMIDALGGQTTLYEPATYWQYSNLGLSLAGEIIAAVSGESYTEYVTAHIIEPLGLADTRPCFPTELHGTQMAVGYGGRGRDGSRPELPPFDGQGVCAAMGFTSTVRDLAKLAAWQHRTLSGKDDSILQRATVSTAACRPDVSRWAACVHTGAPLCCSSRT